MYLLDASAWIEVFIKSEKGELVRNYLKEKACYTGITSLAEISNWATKNNFDPSEFTNFVTQLTQIVDLNENISILAGRLNFERKKLNQNWGMLDSFVLSCGLTYKLKILTTDHHFEDVENVEIL